MLPLHGPAPPRQRPRTSTPAAAPVGHGPLAEPAPATKRLTIEIDHKVSQLTGSGPLDASDRLTMPDLLWHRTSPSALDLLRLTLRSSLSMSLLILHYLSHLI